MVKFKEDQAPKVQLHYGLRIIEETIVEDPAAPDEKLFFEAYNVHRINRIPVSWSPYNRPLRSGKYVGVTYHNLTLKQQQKCLELRFGPELDASSVPRLSQNRIAKEIGCH